MVVAVATVTLGGKNGTVNPADCVAIYPAGLPDVAYVSMLNYLRLGHRNTVQTWALPSATVAFPMPTTAGPYEFRLWRNCATILAKSQVVTVGTSGGAFSLTGNARAATPMVWPWRTLTLA